MSISKKSAVGSTSGGNVLSGQKQTGANQANNAQQSNQAMLKAQLTAMRAGNQVAKGSAAA